MTVSDGTKTWKAHLTPDEYRHRRLREEIDDALTAAGVDEHTLSDVNEKIDDAEEIQWRSGQNNILEAMPF